MTTFMEKLSMVDEYLRLIHMKKIQSFTFLKVFYKQYCIVFHLVIPKDKSHSDSNRTQIFNHCVNFCFVTRNSIL